MGYIVIMLLINAPLSFGVAAIVDFYKSINLLNPAVRFDALNAYVILPFVEIAVFYIYCNLKYKNEKKEK